MTRAKACLEETGYQANSAYPIGALNLNPAFHAHRMRSFLWRFLYDNC